jgi:tetratricopeptide (TPR) repeat protein/WD40 repeat protein
MTVWEVAPGREYLPLAPRPGTGAGLSDAELDVSPDGRWLVAGLDQCRVWDLALRKEIASLPGPGAIGVRVHPRRQEFFIGGSDGLYRWSFESSEGVLRLKPTRRLLPPGQMRVLDVDRDGLLAVIPRRWGATILNLEKPPGQVPPLEHRDAVAAALSPDGRWAATGTQHGMGVLIWNARTGKRVMELIPQERTARPAFSPDGRWLLIATGTELGIWEPGTWRAVRQIPREQPGVVPYAAAFAPDSKVLAAAVSPTTVRLFDTETWRPLARLQGSDADPITNVRFTPDGTRLLVCDQGRMIRVWDLRQIREQLAEAGLDWDRPLYLPPLPSGDMKPVQVEVDAAAYERLARPHVSLKKEGDDHRQTGRWPQAVEAYSKALELDPRFADALFARAGAYTAMGQPDKTLADSDRLTKLNPDNPWSWNARAVTYARLGQPGKAVPDFSRAIELDPKPATFWCNRGVAYSDLGQPEKAVADYTRAIELDQKYETAWLYRGIAYQQLGQPGKAVPDLSRAIELNPKTAWTWSNRGLAHQQLGQYAEATADLEQAAALEPQTAMYPNNLAWLLATCPDPKFRDPDRAVRLAKKAVELAPRDGMDWNTLGVAHYRAGDRTAAIAALEKSMELRAGGDSNDWFFLAMAHWKLGAKDKARRCFDRAVQWMEMNQPKDEELRRFRAEAAELLGIEQPTKDKTK